jgi:Long-chain acyl-CoA synthetases (AMP-forming)
MKRTLIDLFEESVEKFGEETFLLEKDNGIYQSTTYSQTRLLAQQFGAGLCSLGFGKKSNASILSEGRNLWIIGELAIFYAAGVNVPLSVKLEESSDLLFRLIHADVALIMVSSRQLAKIRIIREKLPLVRQIVVFDEMDEYLDGEIYYGDVIKMGIEYLEKTVKSLKSLANQSRMTIMPQ